MQVAAARAGDEFLADAAHDRRAIVGCDRSIEAKAAIGPRCARVPAGPDQVKPESAARRVAEVGGGRRLIARLAGAQIGEQHDPAAVVHLVQDAAVAAFRIGRTQDADVAPELDVAACIARRLVDVDDTAVASMRGIELADGDAVQPFIGAGRVPKAAPATNGAREVISIAVIIAKNPPVPLPPRRSLAGSTGR